VSAPKQDLDEMVGQILVARLSQPDALEALARGDEHEAVKAQAEVQRLNLRLEQARLSAARDEISFAALGTIERNLQEQISAAEAKTREALPLVVRDMAGKNAAKRWNDSTLIARRQVVKSLCEIRVGVGIPGRVRTIHRKDRALKRLSPSRWAGDEKTWGELLG
jgi:hypothetical protein